MVSLTLFTLLGFLSYLVAPVVGQTQSTPGSVFILPLQGPSSNYTFAVNIPENSEDVYFHLSGPTEYSWIAVGTGNQMKDSLMIILYSNEHGDNVTVSPRLCSGEQEPVFSSSLDVVILPGSGIADNTMTVNARCTNCSHWKTGSLDLQSTSQPWIFALGPKAADSILLKSDSKSASIQRHSEYGRFSMNMKQATGGTGGIPSSLTTATGSQQDGHISHDSNWPAIIHGLAACVAFVVFMPLGVIFLRIFPSSVRWHWVNQTLASILAIVGILFGFYLSTMYTKSESFNSAHQIIGIIVLVSVLVQWFIGFWHHRLYKLFQRSTYYGVGHRYFGRAVIILAIVNGGIGLSWSSAPTKTVVAYSIIVAVLGILTIAALLWKAAVVKRQTRLRFTEELELHQQETETRFKNPDNSYSSISRVATDPNGHLW
ncbi:hypothetical protein DTO166G4_8623 [Paecilomyces variotii]|nr:hypothetical protein DTO166G4_8623 [Paecilomyces variotii]KAJ9228423.1 hypothetical protein DTO166G5_8578 [Paecilomyces variotii]KAJ9237385.1 hypothetical protein DTO169E5_5281 [Paecilomyces variotii]KAJ9246689.1 hypothetical protein DTO207G8_8698 [Paecilomyces variotii]KAJ9252316.1 hypothetical protein DTO195F2_7509 [Paecilomyces variotii]